MSSTERARRSRERRQMGTLCLQMELEPDDIGRLVAAALLAPADAQDRVAVARAIHRLIKGQNVLTQPDPIVRIFGAAIAGLQAQR